MRERRDRGVRRVLILIGLALAMAGTFAPWIPHKSAALAVTGLELAEAAKFFPEVQSGAVPIARALFYCPMVASLVLLGLMAGLAASRPVRIAVPLVAAALLVTALLPYSVVESARLSLTAGVPFTLDPGYTGQLRLVVVGAVLTLLVPLVCRPPGRTWGVAVVLLGLAGIVPALWQFALLRPLFVGLYGAPLGPGWGVVASVVGFVLMAAGGAWSAC